MFDSWQVLLGVAVAWVAIGVVLSLAMGRRGHDPFAWGLLGTLLGPLAVALAWFTRRDVSGSGSGSASRRLGEMAPGRPESGPIDVLVGVDGSPEAWAAAAEAERLFGPRLGRLTLATVIPYQPAAEDERRARALLRDHAERMKSAPGLDVLEGHAAAALEQLAVEGGYDVLVIGTRGTGLSKAILGSAASEVARKTKVPVLLVGAGPA